MTKQVIVMRKDLNMRKGKIAAQAGHAAMAFLSRGLVHEYSLDEDEAEFPHTYSIKLNSIEVAWLEKSFTKICVSVDSEDQLREIMKQAMEANLTCHEIIDNGATEFNGVPTLTCCAIGPDEADKIDQVTGHLKLY